MRAVIMSVEGRDAVALTSGGDFKKIRNKGYTVGDKVNITTGYASRIGAVAAAAAVFIIGGSASYFIPASYVCVDINPSFLMTLNIFDKVIDVEPLNGEAENILRYTDIKGKNINDTVETLIDESERVGYIKENGGEVIMSVVPRIKTPKIEDKNTADRVNLVVGEANKKELDEARELGVSIAKAKAVEEYTDTFGGTARENADKLSGRTVKELIGETKKEEKAPEKEKKPSVPAGTSGGTAQSASRGVPKSNTSDRDAAPRNVPQKVPQDMPSERDTAPQNTPQNEPQSAPQRESLITPRDMALRPAYETPEIAAPPRDKAHQAPDGNENVTVNTTEDNVKNEIHTEKEEPEKKESDKPEKEEPVREHRSGGSSHRDKPLDNPPKEDTKPQMDNEPQDNGAAPPRSITEEERLPSGRDVNTVPAREAPQEANTPPEKEHGPVDNPPQSDGSNDSAPQNSVPQDDTPSDIGSVPQRDSAPSIDVGGAPRNGEPPGSGDAPQDGGATSNGGNMDRDKE